MVWFKRKPDPISDRARALNDEIAALEAQIKTLDGRLQHQDTQPRLRSTALPQSTTLQRITAPPHAAPPSPGPVFEPVDLDRLQRQPEPSNTPAHYNDLGIRKYDLPAIVHRLRHHFR